MELNKIIQGNALEILKTFPSKYIDCVITSPPYYHQRMYGTKPQIWDGKGDCKHSWVKRKNEFGSQCKNCNAWEGELGLEPTPDLFISHLIQIFAEVKRVLKDDGTIFVNLGDTTEKKGMLMVPERFAMRMVDELGLKLRRTIIWQKPNILPQSFKDNFTLDYEKIFFFVKNRKYYFQQQYEKAEYDNRKDIFYKGSKKYEHINLTPTNNTQSLHYKGHIRWKEIDGEKVRNMRSVWVIPTEPINLNHFATFPQKLVERLIKSGCNEKGIVLDPFIGSGTTGIVARKLNRFFIGIDLGYNDVSELRFERELGIFK